MDEQRVVQMLATLRNQQSPGSTDWRHVMGVTPACLSLPRFHRAILRKDWTPEDRAHVAGCRYCQRTIEQVQREVWHPTVAQLFWHSVDKLDGDEAVDVRYHLEEAGCRRCLGLLRMLSADGRLADVAKLIREGVAASRDLARDLLNAIYVADAPAIPLAVAAQPAGFSSRTPEPPIRRLTFGDSSLTGSVRAEPSDADRPYEHWLTLQDPQGSAGTLVHVVWINDGHQPAWGRFLMFRAGYRDVVARTKLPGPIEGGEFVMWPIAAGRPQAEHAQLLLESFREASEYDPASVPLWQSWATNALQAVDLDENLRAVLQEIAHEPPPTEHDSAGPSFATL